MANVEGLADAARSAEEVASGTRLYVGFRV